MCAPDLVTGASPVSVPPVPDPPPPVSDPPVPDPHPPVSDPPVSDPPVIPVVDPSSVPQVNSSIPDGMANPIVIPVVHRPTWIDRVVNSPVGMELHLVRDSSKDGEDFVAKFWNHVGKPKVVYFKKGWFFFRFATTADMAMVLRGSTWSLGGYALVLKHWSPEISKELDTVSKVPVWAIAKFGPSVLV
ncbi:hypothetical protein RND81_13G034500 [Saponaria officinalis]|uniref:DUF4283 domain-containing protein n=1 Tax=Saponaria officinalis TaxID=3572 RepID=A0AAW1H3T1_SAPOF